MPAVNDATRNGIFARGEIRRSRPAASFGQEWSSSQARPEIGAFMSIDAVRLRAGQCQRRIEAMKRRLFARELRARAAALRAIAAGEDADDDQSLAQDCRASPTISSRGPRATRPSTPEKGSPQSSKPAVPTRGYETGAHRDRVLSSVAGFALGTEAQRRKEMARFARAESDLLPGLDRPSECRSGRDRSRPLPRSSGRSLLCRRRSMSDTAAVCRFSPTTTSDARFSSPLSASAWSPKSLNNTLLAHR